MNKRTSFRLLVVYLSKQVTARSVQQEIEFQSLDFRV
jgi:hypothetical protein